MIVKSRFFGFLAAPNLYYIEMGNVTKIYTITEVTLNKNPFQDFPPKKGDFKM